MDAKPNLWAIRWHRIATLRSRLVLAADACIGIAAGGAAARTANLGDAIAVGLGAAVAFDVAWHWCQVAGARWRRHHRRGWARELPDVAGSAWCLGWLAYCIFALIVDGTSPAGAAAWGAAWGALLVLLAFAHARRVRRRAERLAQRAQ
ncbi:MAG TPA: hypothetical protein VFQ95_08020 [Rhodanobacteraceae bacterium]|nr:hypothetical protein [Rhodanobacteraceae bacterium]